MLSNTVVFGRWYKFKTTPQLILTGGDLEANGAFLQKCVREGTILQVLSHNLLSQPKDQSARRDFNHLEISISLQVPGRKVEEAGRHASADYMGLQDSKQGRRQ